MIKTEHIFLRLTRQLRHCKKDEKRNRVLVVCEDKELGLIDVIEAGALLLECLRAFTGIEELCFLPLNPITIYGQER